MLRLRILLILVLMAAFAGVAEAQNYAPGEHSTSCCGIGSKGIKVGDLDLQYSYNSEGASRYYRYHANETANLIAGGTYDVTITRDTYTTNITSIYIDYNDDGDFFDAGETIVDNARNVPVTNTYSFTLPPYAQGMLRMRVRMTYSSTLTPTNTVSYGNTEDINLLIAAPVSVDVGQPLEAFAGIGFESKIPHSGGSAPFSYGVTPLTNADWVRYDLVTGRLYGTPPANLVGQQATIQVTVFDGTGGSDTGVVTINFKGRLAIPYSDNFDGSKAGNYQVALGANADANYLPQGGLSGTGLVLCSNQNTPWLLENIANPSVVAVLNTPTSWGGGANPDPSIQVGSATFQLTTTGLRRVEMSFDYKVVNDSTNPNKAYFTNFVVEYAEATENPLWQALGGDNANTKYYRAATAFKKETLTIPLTGDYDALNVRIRWLVRNSYNSPEPTYVGIDNLTVIEPPQITNENILQSALETAPYGPLDLEIRGGTPPYTVSDVASNPIVAGLNLEIVQNPTTMKWQIQSIGGKGPNIGTAGVQDFLLKVTDGDSNIFEDLYTMSILPAPPVLLLNNTALPSTARDTTYVYQLTASGGLPPYNWAVLNAPEWFAIDSLTGTITATVDAALPFGNYPVTIVLKDSINFSVSRTMNLKIVDTLMIDEDVLPDAETARTYVYQLKAAGGSPDYAWSIIAGNKPSGISIDAVTGELFGVPLAGQVGPRSFTVRVSDFGIQVAEKEVTVNVTPASAQTLQVEATSTSLGTLNAGENLIKNIRTLGGVPPYSYTALNSGGLPAGLSLTTNGRIVGKAQAGTEGSYLLRVQIIDAAQAVINVTISYAIEPIYVDPVISTSSIGTHRVGDSFVQLLEVTGGTPPFEWSVDPATPLPAGLELNTSAGSLYGKLLPSSLAQSPVGFRLRVRDQRIIADYKALVTSLGLDNLPANDPQLPAKTYSEVVIGGTILPGEFQALDIPTAQIIPIGEAGGGHYSTPLVATGGVPPYKWSLVGGALPFGLVISADGNLYGNIPASEAREEAYSFRVRATDQFQTSFEQTLSMSVVPDGELGKVVVGPAPDGLANLPAERAMPGGCAVNGSTSTLWFLLLGMLVGLALWRRRSNA